MDWAEFCADNIPAPYTLQMEAYEGGGGRGDIYAAAVDFGPCVVEDTRRRVRAQTQDAAGEEVLSSTTVYGPPIPTVAAGSRMALPSGRIARVLAVSYMDPHGHDLPAHQELNLE